MTKKDVEQCATCRFRDYETGYSPGVPTELFQVCHRRAPVFTSTKGREWPYIKDDDWCGEYAPEQKTKGRPMNRDNPTTLDKRYWNEAQAYEEATGDASLMSPEERFCLLRFGAEMYARGERAGICKSLEMTPHVANAAEAQRRSFAFGNTNMANPAVTREVVDQAADELDEDRKRIEELEVSLCDSQERADIGWARAEHLRRLLVELYHEALRRDDEVVAIKINRALTPDGIWKPKG